MIRVGVSGNRFLSNVFSSKCEYFQRIFVFSTQTYFRVNESAYQHSTHTADATHRINLICTCQDAKRKHCQRSFNFRAWKNGTRSQQNFKIYHL